MDWKQKLATAAAAFVSMPVTTVAEVNSLCGARRAAPPPFRRRIASAPMVIDPGTQDVTSAVYVPEVNQPAACANAQIFVKIKLTDLLIASYNTGGSGDEVRILKEETRIVEPGSGVIFRLDSTEIPPEGGLVRVEVNVVPVDDGGREVDLVDEGSEACQLPQVQASFSSRSANGDRSYGFTTKGFDIKANKTFF